MSKIAVLLLGFGGPECIADVGPFAENIAGRPMPPERLAAVEERYRRIGGGSPLRSTSETQARLIEQKLQVEWPELRVYLGMRYWHPMTSDVIDEMQNYSPERIVLMCLSPYYSYVTSKEYIRAAINDIQAKLPDAGVITIESWNEESDLVDGFADSLRKAVGEAGEGASIVFTAHSIPRESKDSGDPYAGQVIKTSALVAAAAGVGDYKLGWQSEGHGRGEWLKPTVGEVFRELKDSGAERVLVMPVGFTADHVETLYDIDIEMKNQAEQTGLAFSRAGCLNTGDHVIGAMVSAIRSVLGKTEGDGH